MSLVYVVNEPLKQARDNSWERLYDLTPAQVYGELKFVLPSGKLPADPRPSIQQIQDVLGAYTSEDYLLLIGDLIMMACATVVAANAAHGKINFLAWQPKIHQYKVVRIHL